MTATAPTTQVRAALVELLPHADLTAALGFAWRSIRASAHLCPQTPGVHVFALTGRSLTVRYLPAAPEEHLLVGEGSACDLRVPGLAERQLIVRTVRLADGVTAVRLVDLARRSGFRVADGRVTRSVVASGPFAARVGDAVVGAMPHDAASYARAAGGGPAAPLVEHARRLPVSSIPSSRGRRPRICCLPGPRAIADVAEAKYTGVARVALARGRHRVAVDVDADTLTRGVLVGRAAASAPARWRRVLGSNVGRSHLLVFRESGGAVACDLRGPRGTFAAGVPVRGARLPRSATLTLGRVDPTELRIEG